MTGRSQICSELVQVPCLGTLKDNFFTMSLEGMSANALAVIAMCASIHCVNSSNIIVRFTFTYHGRSSTCRFHHYHIFDILGDQGQSVSDVEKSKAKSTCR